MTTKNKMTTRSYRCVSESGQKCPTFHRTLSGALNCYFTSNRTDPNWRVIPNPVHLGDGPATLTASECSALELLTLKGKNKRTKSQVVAMLATALKKISRCELEDEAKGVVDELRDLIARTAPGGGK